MSGLALLARRLRGAVEDGAGPICEGAKGFWYHGTTKDFGSLKTFKKATFGAGASDVPLFFSPSEKFARLYATGKGGRILKVNLRWNKVFDGAEVIKNDRYWPPEREDLTREGVKLYDDLSSGKIFAGVDPDDWGVLW